MWAVCLPSYTICLSVDNIVQILFPVVENPVWPHSERPGVLECLCERHIMSVYERESMR